MPGLPVWVVRAIAVVAAFGASALVGAWILLRLGRRGDGAGRLARWLPGLETLRRPRELATATAVSVLMWATDLAALELVLLALGIELPPGGPMLVLLAINIAITLPAAPAHLGTFELGALLSLEICGVDRAPALAFALLYHAMQAIPLALIGLAELRFLLRTLDRRPPDAP
jgi:uncharacterized protein (TIRG00374 family)